MPNRTLLTEEEIAFAHRQRVARMATADADGHPHIVPVCYAFDGIRFYIPLDEKPKRVDESKLRRGRKNKARPEGPLPIHHNEAKRARPGYFLGSGDGGVLFAGEDLHPQAARFRTDT